MELSTNIIGMLRGNKIFVPDYQRAYSWDTGRKDADYRHQVNTFLLDLEEYIKSDACTRMENKIPYYFGHFLFEWVDDNKYAIIDGQQRLTTIIIFVAALLCRLKEEKTELSEDEYEILEDMIKRRSSYKFSTVQYDDQLFRDYVVDNTKKDHYGITTSSGKRLVEAYDFFVEKIAEMPMSKVQTLLRVVVNASCTTHVVNSEPEAIQMFIFQNNRGKKPSHLEVIKAQFMYHIHIYGGDETTSLIGEVKNRFENIYRSISSIENFVKEDDVLTHTLRVYFNSLWESNATERINAELGKTTHLEFIRKFSMALERSFNNLSRLNQDKHNDINIEASLLCGRYDIVLPFYIKAYSNGVSMSDMSRMAQSVGDIILRDVIIKTRADLRSRLDGVFKSLDNSVEDVVERIHFMKNTTDWWWAYWNNDALRVAMEGNWYSNYHRIAKILLWKYENHLIKSEGKSGYAPISYRSIESPHLEHISPQTENEEVAAGYDVYDEEFNEKYLYCIGNFLLLSAPHNISIGNKPFEVKRSSYNQLRQHREIQELTEIDRVWDRAKIQSRKDKIVEFVVNNL